MSDSVFYVTASVRAATIILSSNNLFVFIDNSIIVNVIFLMIFVFKELFMIWTTRS